MTKNRSSSAAARRAAYRLQLTAALLLVCRQVRRLQTSPEARAACSEVMRELRANGLAKCVASDGLAEMNGERLALLEEKLAWLQRHVTEQDKAMLELAGEIDRLKRRVTEIGQRPGPEPGAAPAIDERPPHY